MRLTSREASNLAEEELSPGQRRTIDEITARARNALGEADPGKDRFLRACAELEGLHALCGDRLTTNEGRSDLHYLMATDTALGHRIGELIASSLREMGRNVELVVPVGLSTRSQASFTAGLRRVVRWCESTLVGQRETGRRVVFHLSGGFKSLLGALNLVGMFYADEVAYRFEGPGALLIRNPSLPLAARLDLSAPELALLAALAECDGLSVRAERVAGWPAALVDNERPGAGQHIPLGAAGLVRQQAPGLRSGAAPVSRTPHRAGLREPSSCPANGRRASGSSGSPGAVGRRAAGPPRRHRNRTVEGTHWVPRRLVHSLRPRRRGPDRVEA